MINVSVKNNISFPKFNFQEDLRVVASRIIIPIMVENINNQVSLDESPLPANNPKYTARKIKEGLSDKILIATGTLFRSFYYKDKGKNTVIVTLKNERKKIGSYLEEMGKHFFGVSTRMEKSAMNYMNNKIKGKLNGGS